MRTSKGKVVASFRKTNRHTGEERTITMRESDLVRMNQFLRDMEIKAVPKDIERQAKDNKHDHRSAA